jgi:IMP cyclohydrolase
MTHPLGALLDMSYPGRIIIIGREPSKAARAVVVYAVTGRSPSSQARRLTFRERAVWTEPSDTEVLSKGNVELLLYRAVALGRGIAVSNGRQTEDIVKALNQAGEGASPGDVLAQALADWTYEPDEPHFTPRISGCVLPGGSAGLALIKRNIDGSPEKAFFTWSLVTGRGKLIATYAGRQDSPLPPFPGDPRDIEIEDETPAAMAGAVFEALSPRANDRDYRVAAACVYSAGADLQQCEVQIINQKDR